MHDWRGLVRRRLQRACGSPPPEAMCAEFADHLEDVYRDAVHSGLSNRAAIRQALRLVPDWGALARTAGHGHGGVMRETVADRVVVPGLMGVAGAAALVTTVVFLPSTLWADPRQWVHAATGTALLAIYAGAGAFAAGWSRYRGGSRAQRVTAAAMPVALQAAIITLLLVVDGVRDVHSQQPFRVQWGLILAMLILPALAVACGTLPFIDDPHSKRSSGVHRLRRAA